MKIISSLINLIFPPRCYICGKVVVGWNGLCADCFKQITFLTEQCCPVCGRPYTFPKEDGENPVCLKCLQNPPKLKALRAAFAYTKFSRRLILPLKHGDRLDLVPFLVNLLYAKSSFFKDIDCLMPVPIHRLRMMKRKYNQSALLAIPLAKKMHKPCLLSVLIRQKNTTSLGHSSREKRKEELKGAFKVTQKNLIKGKKILLIDDVYTSGATLNECAKTLLDAGAKEVYGLVLARICYFEN